MATPNNTADYRADATRANSHSSSSGRFSYSYSNPTGNHPSNANIQYAQATPCDQEQSKAIMKARFDSAAGQKAGGIGLIVAACLVAAPFLALGLIAAITSSAGLFTLFGIGALGCAALLFTGVRKLKLVSAFNRYRGLIGTRDSCDLGQLAASSGASASKTRAHLKWMISKGLFKQATLDESSDRLFLTREAAEQHRLAGEIAAREQHQRNLAASVMEPSSQNGDQPTPDQQQVLNLIEGFIAAIREGRGAIRSAKTSQTLEQIETAVGAILKTAADKPEIIADLDQLTGYYLPTTIKLIDAYRDLETQPIQTDSTQKSMHEIEGALASLNTAFEKILDSLFKDKAIDVSADISVLHTVLAQEGLTENPFEKTNATS